MADEIRAGPTQQGSTRGADRPGSGKTISEGDVLGPYVIGGLLGQGGMGLVFRALHRELNRQVALKLINPDLAADGEFRQRFERESRLAASIEHPNVISVYDAGEIDGIVFISMRLVEGRDFKEVVRAEGPLDPGRAAAIVSQVGDALDAAHSQGLVHRDIKPGNILIEQDGGGEIAYLTDFGLTKHVSSDTQLTHSGDFVGTVDYIAPEQARGESVDARTDVYSLGAVLYQALTGDVPFARDSPVATIWAHINDPPPSPSESRRKEVPSAFDHVVKRAMAKNAKKRFRSAGDLGRAAVAAAEGKKLSPAERSVARGEAAPRRVRRLRNAFAATATVLLVAAAGAGGAMMLSGGDNSSNEPPLPEPPAAENRVVRATTTGVESVGDFQPQFQGLAVAKQLFGAPSSQEPVDSTCVVEWEQASLVVMFANFGAEDPCTPQGSLVQYFGLGEPAGSDSPWRTAEGLRIGDSLERLHQLYPGAARAEEETGSNYELILPDAGGARFWRLVGQPSPIEANGFITVLAAAESANEIVGFASYVGTAGE